jgi:hypothetical protein
MEKKKKPSNRLHALIPEDLFKRLKVMAAVRNITMTEYIIGALNQRIAKEEEYLK